MAVKKQFNYSIKNEIRWMFKSFEDKINSYLYKMVIFTMWREKHVYWPKITCARRRNRWYFTLINRPSTEPQEEYYSGNCNYHAIHTQIVNDNTGVIVYVESCFLGHINDA